MKIELKSIQYSEKLSEETNAFSANLYIDGIKAGTASNRGHGGPTTYRADDQKGQKLIDDAEVYCRSLPSEKFSEGGRDHELKMDLELYIDNLLDKYLQEKEMQKFQGKLEKAMVTGIVAGVPDRSFEVWQFTMPIEKILQHPRGPEMIKNSIIKDIIPVLTGGKIIMNTNIPKKLLEESGLKKNQYAEPVSGKATIQQKENKPPRKGRKL
ncbi:hypothetical protein A0O34_21820 [Chryseobacterium glaciei]|uniref:Uncharacterized protein n=1 Tax=Chryseobacterium glaciei TaxID=1685010 RepID=A0A172Y139_9FLAO|nr:hypothetical protein [Chryseobacterium glaciei]ANF52997.1 hypothetical protein A0O34_21820 [Chryseobacterium glaciei]